jgi:hypothetical protein
MRDWLLQAVEKYLCRPSKNLGDHNWIAP